jgi:hypothetical protein
MLRDFGRALSEAIAESSDVSQTLRRLQEEGYGLIILLDRQSGTASDGGASSKRRRALPPATDEQTGGAPSGPPVFRINGSDLSFLKSIGIDPTRRARGQRKRSRRPPLETDRAVDSGPDSTDRGTGSSSDGSN